MTSTGRETVEVAFPTAAMPNTASISYGLPFQEAVAKHLETTFHASRVYVMASGGLTRSTDCLDRLKTTLGDKIVGVQIGIAQHTPIPAVEDIARAVRETEADCVVTLGAGSLTDAAKLVVLLAANPQAYGNAVDKLLNPNIKSFQDAEPENVLPGVNKPTIPIICIPTSLSAGEYSAFSGATDPVTHVKYQFYDPYINPSLVILDPELSLTTPEWVWLSTGVRAIDHCVEALSSLQSLPTVDDAQAAALAQLVPGLLISKQNPKDLDARLKCQLGAKNSMTSLIFKVMAGASHGIGHMLGPLGVGHGQTSCVLLPFVMKYNKRVNAERQERVKEILWRKDVAGELLAKKGLKQQESDAGDALDVVFRELGMPRSLKEVGVGREKFEGLAEASLKDLFLQSNPIPMTKKEQVMEILNMAAGDQ